MSQCFKEHIIGPMKSVNPEMVCKSPDPEVLRE